MELFVYGIIHKKSEATLGGVICIHATNVRQPTIKLTLIVAAL